MDENTDQLVQETLMRELKDKTLITIAHRLDTIVGYDKILVLDQGKIAEFAAPEQLLEDKKSVFYSMMQKQKL